MYQQINLYQPVFRRQRKVLSAATLLQVFAIVAVLLSVFYLHTRWTLGGLQDTATSLSNQYQQLEYRLGSLESSQAETKPATLEELQRLQLTVEKRQQQLDSISRLTFRESDGFADFFATLATRTLPGLWLTGISLNGDGTTEIRGTTLYPTLVPRYLQAMPEHPRFIALHQGSVRLSRDDPDKKVSAFILSSQSAEDLQ